MKNHRAGMFVVLFALSAFGKADADIDFNGVLDPMTTTTRIDSVKLAFPEITLLPPGWSAEQGLLDTFTFTGVTEWPETLRLHGTTNSLPVNWAIPHPEGDTWYLVGFGFPTPRVLFYGDYGVEESKQVVERPPLLAVSPSVVTGQMTVRLQPAPSGRPIVQIHDAVGKAVRSLSCAAGTDGVATATWNREDKFGRLVPEGVYFCRYAAADVIAVRKVLVAH